HLQVLAERERILRLARLAVERADRRRARLVVEHAAGGAAELRLRGRAERREGAERAAKHRVSSAPPHLRYFMSAATCTLTIMSGFSTGSPFLILSTTFMPETTSPITVYWPFSPDASLYMMKNWLLAELLSPPLRAMPTMPRLNGTCENSACRLGY